MLTRTIKNVLYRYFPPEYAFTGEAYSASGRQPYRFCVIATNNDDACEAVNEMGLSRILYMNRGERVNGMFSSINKGHRDRLQHCG